MKKVAGRIKGDLVAVPRNGGVRAVGSDLDASTQRLLARGSRSPSF